MLDELSAAARAPADTTSAARTIERVPLGT